MEHFTLAELNKLIQQTLENNLEPSYWVVAEIGELRVNQNGHCYLELVQKEEDEVIAKSRATIWSYTYRNLSAWFLSMTGQELASGLKILANLKVTFHEVYGFNLNIKDIDPSFTIGEREKQRQEILAKLESDGVIEMNKQLSLPAVPQKIAVISSPTAAGYEDFTNQLEQNDYGYQIDVEFFPSIMQGPEASESIIAALHKIYERQQSDMAIIIRGGGSKLDLDCFDNYELASHIAQFPLPVVTGIGHERDITIADMVAHTQLKTPTAVAEFIIDGFLSYETQIDDLFSRISTITKDSLQQEKDLLKDISNNLSVQSRNMLTQQAHLQETISNKLQHLAESGVKENRMKLEKIENRVTLLDPVRVLKRGYSITYVNNKPVNTQKVKIGDQLKTVTASNVIISEISDLK